MRLLCSLTAAGFSVGRALILEVMVELRLVSRIALLISALLSANGVAQYRATVPEVPAQAQSPLSLTAPVSTSTAGRPLELSIAAGDLLDISMYGVPDFKTEVRVNSRGEISLPMLGTLALGELTVEQSEKLIERKLIEKALFNDPHIKVFVREYATQGISVLGEVQKPGIYPLLGPRKLYDVISIAGGTTPKAGRYVLITHRNDPQHSMRVPLSAGTQESVENNVPVEPGDTIVVSKAGVVYVVGDVHQPGGFVMENDNGMTVLQAIALAHGTNGSASMNAARLIRKTTAGPEDVPLPLQKILAAKAPDPPLQPDDIVFVPSSAGKNAAKRGAEAILQMATGVVIWRLP